MGDIRNKNELRRRIDLFLHDFTSEEYKINEEFCKETMRMMAEFIGHVDNRLDSANAKIAAGRKRENELAEYIIKKATFALFRWKCNASTGSEKMGAKSAC